MKKYILMLLLIIPFTVYAVDGPKVLTLDANYEDHKIVYSGTMEDGSHAVMCKLYLNDEEIDMLSSSVDDNEFNGSFVVTSQNEYVVTCANYEGGDIKNKIVNVVFDDEETTYTVIFNTNGGSNINSVVVEENTTVNRPEDPEKDGYIFVGWYEDVTLTREFNFSTKITSDTTLYAKWVENIVEYTVEFNTNGGSNIGSVNVVENTTVNRPEDPEKDGYIFVGWYEDVTLTREFDFHTEITSDITLYAKWEEENPTKTYTIEDKNSENSVSFKEEIGHEFSLSIIDYMLFTDEDLEKENISKEQYNEIFNSLKESTKKYGTLLAFYGIIVEDENQDEIDPGETTVRIKMTDAMKKYNSFGLMYANDEFELDEPIELKVVDGYLVGTLPHLSNYALVGNKVNNPKTADSIFIWISILTISLITLGYGTYKLKRIKL